jgi:hypothetical protein
LGRKLWEAGEDCNNEELYNVYSASNIITVIRSRRMRWVRHVVSMREMKKCIQNFGRKNHKGREHLKVLGVDGRIILEWILGR